MVLEELGRQVEVDGHTLVVRRFERTAVVGVTDRCAVRQLVLKRRTVDRHVVVGGDADLVDEVLPIGVGRAEERRRLVGQVGIGAENVLLELGGVHHLHGLVVMLDRDAAVVGDAGLAALAFLGGDEDDAVRCARTVDGRGRSVLQNGERSDVVGVDHRQSVGHARACVVGHGYAVDDDQRVVARRERCAAADADFGTCAGSSVARDDVHARHLAAQELLRRSKGTAVDFLGLDGDDRTGHVVLLDGAVTDDHHLVERHEVLLEHHACQVGRRSDALQVLIADEADLDGGITVLDGQHVLPVEIGRRTVGGSQLHHGGSDDRIAGSVDDDAFDLVTALPGECEGGGADT